MERWMGRVAEAFSWRVREGGGEGVPWFSWEALGGFGAMVLLAWYLLVA
jgi:hypothetical protein